jgi:hypothetical protein
MSTAGTRRDYTGHEESTRRVRRTPGEIRAVSLQLLSTSAQQCTAVAVDKKEEEARDKKRKRHVTRRGT